MYECVDKNPDTLPGSAADTNGTLFYHVEASCNGMLCPPYDREKELTCAVCTKQKASFCGPIHANVESVILGNNMCKLVLSVLN